MSARVPHGILQMTASNFLKMLEVLDKEFKPLAISDKEMIEELKLAPPDYAVIVNFTQDKGMLVINGTVPLVLYTGVLTSQRYNELVQEFATNIVI